MSEAFFSWRQYIWTGDTITNILDNMWRLLKRVLEK